MTDLVITDPEERAALLCSLDDVGTSKAVGYLPLYTIRKFLDEKVPNLAKIHEARGLGVRVFTVRQCCIKSGALFVFDAPAVQTIIDKHTAEIARKTWKPEVGYVIRKLARKWYAEDDDIMPFIRELYGA